MHSVSNNYINEIGNAGKQKKLVVEVDQQELSNVELFKPSFSGDLFKTIMEQLDLEQKNGNVLTDKVVKSKYGLSMHRYAPELQMTYNEPSKNLCNVVRETTTINGVTVTINPDKSVTCSGTSTATFPFYLTTATGSTNTIDFEAGKKYIISGCSNGSSTTFRLRFRYTLSDDTTTYTDAYGKKMFQPTLNGSASLSIVFISGAVLDNVTIYPMVEEVAEDVTEPSEYTPYDSHGGQYYLDGEITQETRSGKNLFDVSSLEQGTISTSGVEQSHARRVRTGFIPVSELAYILSLPEDLFLVNAHAYDVSKNWLRTLGQSKNITLTSEVKFIKIVIRYQDGTNVTPTDLADYEIQLESGSTATEYQPYGVMPSPEFESPAIIKYPAGTYKTYIDKWYYITINEDLKSIRTLKDRLWLDTINNSVEIVKKVDDYVLNGTEDYISTASLSASPNGLRLMIAGVKSRWGMLVGNATFYCSRLKQVTSYNSDVDGISSTSSNSLYVYMYNYFGFTPETTSEEMLSTFKTWLTTHNMTVHFPLVTAGTIECSVNTEYVEYIEYNDFNVYSSEYNYDTNICKSVAYDNMLKFMVAYSAEHLNLTYPKTVLELVQAICTYVGVDLYSTDFYNSNLTIDEDLFTNLSCTYRDILDYICQATCSTGIIKENKLYFKIPTETNIVITPRLLKKMKVISNFGPCNSLVLGRGDLNDNIYSKDNASILQYGLQEIKFDNNEIVDKKREIVIDGMFNQIKELLYNAFEISDLGIGIFEPADIAKIEDLNGVQYTIIILNQSLKLKSGCEGNMSANVPDTSTTQYQYATDSQKRQTKTEIIVNKQEKIITAIVEEQTETDKKLTEYNQSLEGFNYKVAEAGGINLIQNSTLEIGTTTYHTTIGTVSVEQNQDIKTNTTSKTAIKINTGSVTTQSIGIIEKTDYCFSCLIYKKELANVIVKIISDKIEEYVIEAEPETWQKFSAEINSSVSTVTIEVSCDNNFCYVSDRILNKGNSALGWQRFAGEFKSANVSITEDGIIVENSTDKMKHIITSSEDKIINTLNGETEVTFNPDKTIMKTVEINTKCIKGKIRETVRDDGTILITVDD